MRPSILHRRLGEHRRIEVVEAGDVDRIIGTADLLDVAVAEGRDATGLAETVMHAVAAELVVGNVGFVTLQAETVGLYDCPPIAPLPADRAIALACAGIEVDIGLIADISAMAASLIGQFHNRRSCFPGPGGPRFAAHPFDNMMPDEADAVHLPH